MINSITSFSNSLVNCSVEPEQLISSSMYRLYLSTVYSILFKAAYGIISII